jgi:hypothetical protein
VLAKALQAFWLNSGKLPLMGTLPDMEAHSKDYQRLLKVFKDEAAKDAAHFTKIVERLCEMSGRTKEIPAKQIKLFLKNVR